MVFRGCWFPTYMGKRIDLDDIDPGQIDFTDIAHSLSQISRYNGHTTRSITVAEHCVRLSHLVPERVMQLALLHDAAEYVLCDVPRPVKARLPDYASMEKRLLECVLRKYGVFSQLNAPEAAYLWRVDQVFPLVEMRSGLMPFPNNLPPMHGEDNEEFVSFLTAETLKAWPYWGWPSQSAEDLFKRRATQLHLL